jgi:hypothetical protein
MFTMNYTIQLFPQKSQPFWLHLTLSLSQKFVMQGRRTPRRLGLRESHLIWAMQDAMARQPSIT